MSQKFRESLLSAIETLNDAGISMFMFQRNTYEFHVHVCAQVILSTTDLKIVELIIEDWDKGVAAYYGVTVSHLKKWMEAKSTNHPQCMAYTKNGKGKRCQNRMFSKAERIPDDPSKWSSEAPVYCPKHGGGVQ